MDHVLAGALAARNLAIVERMETATLTTPCPSCLSAFKKAHAKVTKDKAFKDEVNQLLDLPYKGGVTAKSTLQTISENVGFDTVCGRCNIGSRFIYKDGPVFSLAQLKRLKFGI